MKRCASCNADLPDALTVCTSCGADLSDESRIAGSLDELHDFLEDWTKGYRHVVENVAPRVQEASDQVDLIRGMLQACPREAAQISTDVIQREASRALALARRSLPKMPTPGQTAFSWSATSTSSAATSFLSQVSHLGEERRSPEILQFVNTYSTQYSQLQEAQQRPGQVRSLMEKKATSLLGRMDAAIFAYQRFREGAGLATGAATSMRNLLHGLDSVLLQLARRYPREQKLTWSEISERLGNSPDSHAALLAQASTNSELNRDLSTALKERGPQSIEGLWSRLLDHLFVVLSELPSTPP